MKKVLLLLVLCLSVINIKAQDRIDETSYEFSHISKKLKNIDWWSYSEFEGKWKKHRKDFKYLQMASFEYNNTTYYVLIKSKREVDYSYPTGRFGRYNPWTGGYISWTSYDALLLSQEQYNGIINPSEQGYIIEAGGFVHVTENDNNIIIRNLIKDLNTGPGSAFKNTIIIKRHKNAIRFDFQYSFFKFPINNIYYETSIKEWNKLKIK